MNIQIEIDMTKKQFKKEAYLSPWCKIIVVETANVICVSSKISPNALDFEEEDYSNEPDIDSGEFETE